MKTQNNRKKVQDGHQKLAHTIGRMAKVRGEELEVKPWMGED